MIHPKILSLLKTEVERDFSMGIVFWYDTKSKWKQKTSGEGLGIHEIMPPMIVDRPGGFDGYLFMLFYPPALIETARGKKNRPLIFVCPV